MVVALGQRLDHVDALGLGPVAHVFGHGHFRPLDAHVVLVHVGDHAHQVDDRRGTGLHGRWGAG